MKCQLWLESDQGTYPTKPFDLPDDKDVIEGLIGAFCLKGNATRLELREAETQSVIFKLEISDRRMDLYMKAME